MLCRRAIAVMLLTGSWMGTSAQKLLNDTGLYPVYEAMDTSTNAVSVLHLGDSHVQGGFFPDAVRKELQDKFGYAGRGFVFPYNLAGTNGPHDYRWSSFFRWTSDRMVDRNLSESPGPGGIVLKSPQDRQAALLVYHNDSTIGKLKVWYRGKGLPEIRPTENERQDVNESIVYEGNSNLPVQEAIILAGSGMRTLSITFPDISRMYGALEVRDAKGILYSAIGINGAQFQHYNIFEGSVAGEAAIMTKPSLVILSLGTNEAFGAVTPDQLKAEMEKTVVVIREQAPGVQFIFTTPPSGMMKKRQVAYRPKGSKRTKYRTKFTAVPQAAVLRQAIMEFCRENGHACWDLFGDMRNDSRFNRAWSHDHVHFNAYGYQLQGELLGKAILNGYNNWQQNIRKN
ncbi:GDSL-type esterase/lipase family protein [Chitinophaga deserti]|uniref:GDSL-type esterase/lipase family protein n=1 Tax=Chitinophaga deserti TaxID=2164099 RepID=UPI0018E55713|nr:GDSL-type esterase/lipase family protein [Chitinophaga deserti]